MLTIVDWNKDQLGRLNHVRKVRLGRGKDPMSPLSLDGVTIPTSRSPAYRRLVEILGLRLAELARGRVYEYLGLHAAQDGGRLAVERKRFGGIVLARAEDPVGRALGERVYDALIESGMATPLVTAPRTSGAVTGRKSVPTRGDGTARPAVPSRKAPRDGTSEAPVTAPCDGTAEPPVPSQRADVENPPGGESAADGGPAHLRVTCASPARDLRASGDAVSSLGEPSCADTEPSACAAPCSAEKTNPLREHSPPVENLPSAPPTSPASVERTTGREGAAADAPAQMRGDDEVELTWRTIERHGGAKAYGATYAAVSELLGRLRAGRGAGGVRARVVAEALNWPVATRGGSGSWWRAATAAAQQLEAIDRAATMPEAARDARREDSPELTREIEATALRLKGMIVGLAVADTVRGLRAVLEAPEDASTEPAKLLLAVRPERRTESWFHDAERLLERGPSPAQLEAHRERLVVREVQRIAGDESYGRHAAEARERLQAFGAPQGLDCVPGWATRWAAWVAEVEAERAATLAEAVA